MRILIDECLDWRLTRALPQHYVQSVQRMGWSGLKNGQLLAAMVQAGFNVFITGDRNLQFQQNVAQAGVAVVVPVSSSTKLANTLLLMPAVIVLLPGLRKGTVTNIP